MCCEVRGIETLIETRNERGRGLSFASELWRYVTTGTGMLTYSASLCAASVRVLEESATPDLQCVFAPASYKPGLIRKLDDKPGITGVPWQMRPLSLLARTPDPHDQPAINPRYLAEDTDRRAMVGGFKFLRRAGIGVGRDAHDLVGDTGQRPAQFQRNGVAQGSGSGLEQPD
jgi:choline dehydrogenase